MVKKKSKLNEKMVMAKAQSPTEDPQNNNLKRQWLEYSRPHMYYVLYVTHT